MDQETATENADMSWPELSADLTLARTQARSIMLDTQRANSDGRILELAAQLELMRTRMTSLEQHLFESQSGVAHDLIERLGNIDSALHATEVRFNGFANRISAAEEFASTTMLSTTTAIDARIDAGEVARRAQATELEELSSFLEQSFTRIAELSDLVEAERALTLAGRDEHDRHFTALSSKMSLVEKSLSDLDGRIDEAFDNVEYASAEAVEELKRSIVTESSRIDENNSRIEAHSVRLDEWAERIDEDGSRIEDVAARVDQADKSADETNDRVAAIDLKLEQQFAAQDEISSAIHFLQSRAEAIETLAASNTSETGEEFNSIDERIQSANRRIDESLANVAALRSEFESAEPEVSAELLGSLEARVTANGNQQEAILRTLDEVAAGFEARIQQQDGVLEAHSTILESTTQLLTDHNAMAASNTAAIAAADARATTHEETMGSALHAVEDLANNAQSIGHRIDATEGQVNELTGRIDTTNGNVAELKHRADETNGQVNELTGRIDTTNGNVAELKHRADETNGQVNELTERIDTTNGNVAELDERIDTHGENVEELTNRVGKAEHAAQQAIVAAASSVSTSETVLRTKTAELETRLQQATERIDGLDIAMPDDSEARERVDLLEPIVETHTHQIEAVNDWVTALDRHTKKVDEQAATAAEQIAALNDWSTELDSRILEIQNDTSIDEETQQEIEAVKAHNVELRERTNALEETSSDLQAKLDEIARASRAIAAAETAPSSQEVRSLNARVDELGPTIEILDQKIEAVNDWVTVVDGRILDIQEQGNTTQQQIEAVNDWVTDLDRRSTETDSVARNASDRVSDLDQRTSHLEERFGATERRIEEIDVERASFARHESDVTREDLARLSDELQSTAPLINTHEEKIQAINDWVTTLDGRILEIHEQGSNAELHFEAVNDWSTTLDGRILELQRENDVTQKRIEAVNDWSTTLDGRILDIQEQGNTTQQQIEAVNDWVTVVDGRILELTGDGEVVQEQIEAVNDWATNLEIRTFEMDSRLAQTQHVLVEMTNKLTMLFERDQPDAGLKRQVEELAAATAQLQAKANDPSAAIDIDTFSGQVEATERSVLDLQASVKEWIGNLEQARTNATNELRDFMVYRIDTAEDRIDRRLADIEASGAGNERLEAIERAVADADERARDAYAFSENLRLLQTDLVQAIRGEMATQAEQIDRHSQALQTGAPPASANPAPDQIAGVNARVDEVTRGLRHLNDIQQRHGTVESKLTEALSSTNTALRQAQQDVASLQNGLQTALARIGQLEAQVAAAQQQP